MRYNKRHTNFGEIGTMFMGLLFIVLIFAAFYGYISNIVKLVDCDFKAPYKCEAVHTVGLIPVVGMITGYIETETK